MEKSKLQTQLDSAMELICEVNTLFADESNVDYAGNLTKAVGLLNRVEKKLWSLRQEVIDVLEPDDEE